MSERFAVFPDGLFDGADAGWAFRCGMCNAAAVAAPGDLCTACARAAIPKATRSERATGRSRLGGRPRLGGE